MEAMILAAGSGTRMGPHTETRPKALVDLHGAPLIEWVAARLIAAGADRLIVNTHHFAEQIESHTVRRDGFGVEVRFSREEPYVLDTGGALLRAAPLFEADRPFLVHNVDILTDADLAALYQAHEEGEPSDGRIATLAVNRRPTSRPLFADRQGICGRANRTERWEVVARHPSEAPVELGFAGIHVLSPRIFARLTEHGTFSIIDTYMRLIGEGERVAIHDISGARWADVGTPERLAEAAARFRPSESPRAPGAYPV